MTDTVTPEKRSKIMSAVRSHKTIMENKVSSELWKRGFRFRKNVRDLPGTPDIAIKKYKLVIFLDSCFWHYCENHRCVPKTNTQYWLKKLEKNHLRDCEITLHYIKNGWNIIRVWEHQLKSDFSASINDIVCFIEKAKNGFSTDSD